MSTQSQSMSPRVATPSQRDYVRRLLRIHELPVSRVTVMHRDIFRACGIDWTDGADMDALLYRLDPHRIGRLIDHLRRMSDTDEGDDA